MGDSRVSFANFSKLSIAATFHKLILEMEEVKFRPEHTQSMGDFSTVEPITEETVTKLRKKHSDQQEEKEGSSQAPMEVVVEKTSSTK